MELKLIYRPDPPGILERKDTIWVRTLDGEFSLLKWMDGSWSEANYSAEMQKFIQEIAAALDVAQSKINTMESSLSTVEKGLQVSLSLSYDMKNLASEVTSSLSTANARMDTINSKIASMDAGGVLVAVVDTLPQSPSAKTLYFLKNSTSDTNNLYTEYMYINSAWEILGSSTNIVLSGVQPTDSAVKIWINPDESGLDVYTKTEVDTLLSGYEYMSVSGTSVTQTLASGKYYIFSDAVTSLTITLSSSQVSGRVPVYMLQFTCGTSPSVVFPSDVKWSGETAPAFTAGVTYQIRIINNIATF